MRNPLSRQTKSRWTASSLTSLSLCVKAGGSTWRRGGSGKPQQNAAAMCGPSFGERPERQAAADRSMCSRLLSSGSQVRVLPGAWSGGRFGSGVAATALADGQDPNDAVEASWKREVSGRLAGELCQHLGGVPSRPASLRPRGSLLRLAMRGCSGLESARSGRRRRFARSGSVLLLAQRRTPSAALPMEATSRFPYDRGWAKCSGRL
jgi:hypothetical protein